MTDRTKQAREIEEVREIRQGIQARRHIIRIEGSLHRLGIIIGEDSANVDHLGWGTICELGQVAHLLDEIEDFYQRQPR